MNAFWNKKKELPREKAVDAQEEGMNRITKLIGNGKCDSMDEMFDKLKSVLQAAKEMSTKGINESHAVTLTSDEQTTFKLSLMADIGEEKVPLLDFDFVMMQGGTGDNCTYDIMPMGDENKQIFKKVFDEVSKGK